MRYPPVIPASSTPPKSTSRQVSVSIRWTLVVTRRATASAAATERSGHDAVFEALHADPCEQDAEADQRAVDRGQRHVWDVADQRGAETLGHVHDGVGEHEDLQPTHTLQRLPWKVGATQERERQDDQREQQRHLERLHLGA